MTSIGRQDLIIAQRRTLREWKGRPLSLLSASIMFFWAFKTLNVPDWLSLKLLVLAIGLLGMSCFELVKLLRGYLFLRRLHKVRETNEELTKLVDEMYMRRYLEKPL